MSQVTDYMIAGSPLTMAQLHTVLENIFAAIGSQNRGATAPSNPFEGMLWWDTTTTPVEILKRYAVTASWVSVVSINITTGAISFFRTGGTDLISAFALTLLDDADAAAVLVTLGIAAVTMTFTNKRITPRITAITSSGTPAINTDNCDMVDITALAEAITSMTTNLSGTPTNKQKLIFEIKDNGTGRAITWGASFVAGGVALPTTTVANKILSVGFIYSTANALNKWRCVASALET